MPGGGPSGGRGLAVLTAKGVRHAGSTKRYLLCPFWRGRVIVDVTGSPPRHPPWSPGRCRHRTPGDHVLYERPFATTRGLAVQLGGIRDVVRNSEVRAVDGVDLAEGPAGGPGVVHVSPSRASHADEADGSVAMTGITTVQWPPDSLGLGPTFPSLPKERQRSRPRPADGPGGASLVCPGVDDERGDPNLGPYEAGQQRHLLRAHIEAALARRLGMLTRCSVSPGPGHVSEPGPCYGWPRLVGYGHNKNQDADAPRRLSTAAGR